MWYFCDHSKHEQRNKQIKTTNPLRDSTGKGLLRHEEPPFWKGNQEGGSVNYGKKVVYTCTSTQGTP